MNAVSLFQDQARQRPLVEALVEGRGAARRAVTFAELDARGAQAAGRLLADGVRPGDAVLLMVPLSIDLYVLVAGILRAGAAVMLVDLGAGRAHIDACLARRPPDVFIGTRRAHLLRLASGAVRRVPRRYALGGWVPGAQRWGGGEAAPVAAVSPEATALLTFTSGSTGRPKAIARTHGFLAAQHRTLASALGLAPEARDLSTLPVFVLANLASGVTSILPDADMRRPGEVDAAPILEQIRAERATTLAASPSFAMRLAEASGAMESRALASGEAGGARLGGTPARSEPKAARGLTPIQTVAVGGAPVFPDVLDALARAAPEAVAVYGSSEAEPIAHVRARDVTNADRARTASGGGLLAGTPVPEIELRIVPDAWGTPLGPLAPADWDALALPPEAPGEIVVAGAHVLGGYLGGEGDHETKVRVGDRTWHRTGDAGVRDARGRVWLLGRCSAAVRDASGVLYPLQVEAAARAVDGVAFAALVPAQRVLAFEGIAPPEAVEAALTWASLRAVRVDAIPLDARHNAKVDYPELARRLA